MQIAVAVAVIVVCAASVSAQTTPPAPNAPSAPNAPTRDTDLTKLAYVSAADIAAGLKKLPQDRADIAFRIFQVPPYNVNAAHRAPVTQVANIHDDQSELFMVIDGTGTIVWGGTVVAATRNGANVTGKSIDGGTRQKLSKGDFFLVPPGMPHMFADIAPTGLQLMQIYLPKSR